MYYFIFLWNRNNFNIDARFYDVNLYGVTLQMKGQCLNGDYRADGW